MNLSSDLDRPTRDRRPGRRLTAGLALLAALLLPAVLGVVPASAAPGHTAPLTPGPVTAAEDSPFVDVATTDPYYEAIYYLWFWDIIDGYPIGGGLSEFRPDNPVARQHFTKMIVRGLVVPVTELDACPFGDVEVSGLLDLYPDNYIAAAFRESIVNGKSPGQFDPYGSITRAQLMSMVVRAIQDYAGRTLEEPDPAGYAGYMRQFDDPTHGHNAQLAEWNGLLEGIPLAGWDPWGNAGRGEVAQILYNTINYLGGFGG